MSDSKERFSSRVDNYVKFRPGYPAGVVDVLARECGLSTTSTIADVGSGTGISTEVFLRNGNRVYAVEPNREMREAAERLLADYDGFVSVDGAAEATTLDDASVDLVTAGQAFHWFDQPAARAEFARIVKPGGWTALMWNIRNVEATPFMREYERLLREFGTDYESVSHHGVDDSEMEAFFAPNGYTLSLLENAQTFDYEGLEGRLLSSSYVPEAGHAGYEPMLAALRGLFDRHATDDRVEFEYQTKIYFGRLD